ncbi:MAG: ornithine cyclodeaminase family protein [Chloroflexi bacterium]|nr:ornithine cyclodeaminase family protein [Chloroflexota bacterium]
MAIYLTENDVRGLLDMKTALTVLDEAFKAVGRGEAVNRPRSRIPLSNGSYNLMSAAWYTKGVVGHKSYTATRNGARFHVMLYDAEGKGLLAIIEAGYLGKIRTGAATGLATRYLARPGDGVAAIIGSGNQAESQLEAIAAAGKARAAVVYSRTAETRDRFAKVMSERLGLKVTTAATPEEAVADAASVTLITNSPQPVLKSELLQAGLHVNAAGNNTWLGQEIDTAAMSKFDVIVADDVDQARIESGELMRAAETGKLAWTSVISLADVVSGEKRGRRSDQDITLFESQGIALEDVAVAQQVYAAAVERNLGVRIG